MSRLDSEGGGSGVGGWRLQAVLRSNKVGGMEEARSVRLGGLGLGLLECFGTGLEPWRLVAQRLLD